MSMGRRPMPLSHGRVFAVRRELEERRESARLASHEATDERQRAALRGKFHAYGEALHMIDALDKGRILTRLFRTPPRRRGRPVPPLVVGGFPASPKISEEQQ